ncbi:tyrosine-type recombinase/integrase [Lachnospiraceae bacterium 48-42]
MYALIHENDICKDNGERMGFATHLFRHCYGMKLVEMHLDDAAIAHLLGHRGVNTVYRYRRASGKLMVKETEELRKTMDEILSEIIKEWDGYEQVFQNG